MIHEVAHLFTQKTIDSGRGYWLELDNTGEWKHHPLTGLNNSSNGKPIIVHHTMLYTTQRMLTTQRITAPPNITFNTTTCYIPLTAYLSDIQAAGVLDSSWKNNLHVSCSPKANCVLLDATRSYRDKFIHKIVELHRSFVRSLVLLINVYMKPLKHLQQNFGAKPESDKKNKGDRRSKQGSVGGMPNATSSTATSSGNNESMFIRLQDIHTIFGNVESLLKANFAVMSSLDAKMAVWNKNQTVADIFLNIVCWQW